MFVLQLLSSHLGHSLSQTCFCIVTARCKPLMRLMSNLVHIICGVVMVCSFSIFIDYVIITLRRRNLCRNSAFYYTPEKVHYVTCILLLVRVVLHLLNILRWQRKKVMIIAVQHFLSMMIDMELLL